MFWWIQPLPTSSGFHLKGQDAYSQSHQYTYQYYIDFTEELKCFNYIYIYLMLFYVIYWKLFVFIYIICFFYIALARPGSQSEGQCQCCLYHKVRKMVPSKSIRHCRPTMCQGLKNHFLPLQLRQVHCPRQMRSLPNLSKNSLIDQWRKVRWGWTMRFLVRNGFGGKTAFANFWIFVYIYKHIYIKVPYVRNLLLHI